MTDRLQANEVMVVPVPHLVARLKQLWQHHIDAGRISHALGVQSAIALIQREVKASYSAAPSTGYLAVPNKLPNKPEKNR